MISQIDLLVNMSPTWEGGKCQTGFNKSCVTLLMMRTSRTSRIFMSTTLSLLASLPTNLAWVTASARFTTATCTPGLPQPAGVQVCRCAGVQVCRCAGLHLFICSGVQVFKRQGVPEVSPVWKTSRIRELFWEHMICKHNKFEFYISVNVVIPELVGGIEKKTHRGEC